MQLLSESRVWSGIILILVAVFFSNPCQAQTADWTTNWPNANDDHIEAMANDPNNPNVIYASSQANMWRSDDKGDSWYSSADDPAYIARPNPGGITRVVYGLAVGPLDYDGASFSIVYAGTDDGIMHDLTLGGSSWFFWALDNYKIVTIAPDHLNKRYVYAGATTGKGLHKSDEYGDEFDYHYLPLREVYGIVIDPRTSAQAATIYAATDNGIYKSENAGITWPESLHTLAGIEIHAVAIDPQSPDVLFAGTKNPPGTANLWRSEDAGDSWVDISIIGVDQYDNPDLLAIHDLVVDPNSTGQNTSVYAATYQSYYKGKVWVRKTSSGPWEEFSSGLPVSTVDFLAIDPVNLLLHAGTTSAGVHRSPIPCNFSCDAVPPMEAYTNIPSSWDGEVASRCAPPDDLPAGYDYDYLWSFEQAGSVDTYDTIDASHVFTSSGYSLPWTFTAYLDDGSGNTIECSHASTINVYDCVCNATAPSQACKNSDVYFHAGSDHAGSNPGGCLGNSASYTWHIDGAQEPLDGENPPPYKFTSPGSYGWSVDVSVGAEYSCSYGGTINICDLSCSATGSPDTGIAPLAVQFSGNATLSANCSDSLSYLWEFGDGSQSTEMSPIHTYTEGGSFTWTLTVTGGECTCVKSGVIVVDPPPCNVVCDAFVDPEANQCEAVLFDSDITITNCANSTILWDFGDGGTSDEEDPEYQFYDPGNHSWSLTVTAEGATPCFRNGSILIHEILRGDQDRNGTVSVGEVQAAINMFLGAANVLCCVDRDKSGSVSIGEVQSVINAFLGVSPAGGDSTPPPGDFPQPTMEILDATGDQCGIDVPILLLNPGAPVAAAAYYVENTSPYLVFQGASIGSQAGALGKEIAYHEDPITHTITLGVLGKAEDSYSVSIPTGVIAVLHFTGAPGAGFDATLTGSCGYSDASGNDYPSTCSEGTVTYVDQGPVNSVSGTVTNGPGILVGYTGSDGVLRHVNADANGDYAIDLCPDTYTISPRKKGCSVIGGSQVVTVPPDHVLDFTMNCTYVDRCFMDYHDGMSIPANDPLSIGSLHLCLLESTEDPHSPLYNKSINSTTFTRAAGPPEWQTYTFTLLNAGTYYINVVNGDREDKDTMITSGRLNIDTVGEIYKPNDFNNGVDFMTEPVWLEAGTHTIEVRLTSKPDAYITVIVSDADFTDIIDL